MDLTYFPLIGLLIVGGFSIWLGLLGIKSYLNTQKMDKYWLFWVLPIFFIIAGSIIGILSINMIIDFRAASGGAESPSV